MLERALDPAAVFTCAEIALITPLASAVAPFVVADERTIRQAVGSLAAALPAQATDDLAGKLKLNTYQTMLAGCDQRALASACRRCLDELDWFPTVRQLKERIDKWVSDDVAAIRRARLILRSGKREQTDVGDMMIAGIRAMKPELRELGLAAGYITQEQIDQAFPDDQREAA